MELRGLFGHELGHYLLWSLDGGKYLTASEMLQALITDAHAHPAHFASWRLFRLYTEIFCDRVAWRVTNELAAVVSMLVKVQTGVSDVDAAAYLRQAEEIFARGEIATQDLTHPEAFIRARSVQLWAEQHARVEQSITGMIGGKPGMDELDLLEQTRVSQLTRRVIDSLLCHKWMQTDAVLAHARLFFEDYSPPAELLIDVELPTALRLEPDSVRDYYCYVLLDFVTVDRELDEPPLAVMLTLAELWNMKPRLLELLRQELKLRKNQLEKLDKNKVQLLAEANRLAVQP